MQIFRTPADTIEVTNEVKKSRFIARAGLATTREQAMALLADARRDYPDAGHHCWAYLLGSSSAATSAAMSDDGEPSGTAGKPILNVLQHKDIGDVIVVVTRYFGGIRLGAGGLVRAYSGAAQLAMEALPVQEHRAMLSLVLEGEFASEQAVRHWLGLHDGAMVEVDYADRVSMVIEIPEELAKECKQFALANGCSVRNSG